MGIDRTTGTPELLVTLDRSGADPIGRQLQEQLRSSIRSGRLPGGERLPSSRTLADQLGVSRGLVVQCYEQLQSEGYLDARTGAGSVVAPGVADARSSGSAAPSRRPAFDVDFEYGVPDLESFPRREWASAMGHACRTATLADIGDDTGGGSGELREVLASYGRRVRASAIHADRVVIVCGFRHGLNVVLRALAGRGITSVALEDPGPREHDVIAERCGMRAVPVGVDEQGLDVAELAASGARAVIVTPAHQCPTGVLLSAARRQALVDWAHAVDGYIIEDDFDAEFRYDRQPVGSIQGIAPERVIALGSVSKTLAPTIRIGWIVVPGELIGDVIVEKHLMSRGVPGFDQLALAHLIVSGRFDQHLRQVRSTYRHRREVLVATVAEAAPEVVVTGLAAGCHAVLRLPDGVDEIDVVAGCAARRVGVAAIGRYRLRPAPDGAPGQLVLGFGNVAASAIVGGLGVLGDVVRSLTT